MFVQIILFVGGILLADVPTDKHLGKQIPPKHTRVKSLAELRKLSSDEHSQYIERLAEERNYPALRELCQAGIGYAITVYVGILDDKKAVLYCKELPFGSYEWEHAFWGLSYHNKDAVIGYVKEVYAKKTVEARQNCYSLCLKIGWEDLVEEAKKDLNDNTPTYPYGKPLGAIARMYIEYLPEVQKRLKR